MNTNRIITYVKRLMDLVESLPGNINEFKSVFDEWRTDWTAARAGKLDLLDVEVSSRASSLDVDNVRRGVDTTNNKLDQVQTGIGLLEDSVQSIDVHVDSLITKTDTLIDGSVGVEELPSMINRVYKELPTNTTNQTTLCDVSGSGALYCAASVSMTDTSQFNLIVTIDGKTTNFVGRCDTDDYQSYDTGIIAKPIVNWFGNGDGDGDWRVKSANLPFVQSQVCTSRTEGMTLASQKSLGGTKALGEILLLKKPLRFKSGLTVKANRTSADIGTLPIIVVYSLD